MRMMGWGLGMLLAMPFATNAVEPATPSEVEFGAGAWVDVDATGKAHVVEMDRLDRFKDEGSPGSLVEIIEDRLRERIESWQFQPPTKNGVAVSGRTHVNALLVAEDDRSGNIRLRVKRANTGMAMKQRPSFMPLAFEMGGASGWRLVVHLEIDPQGHVAEARIVNSSVFNGREFIPRRSYLDLTKVTLRTVRQIEFEMERVDGQPIAGGGDLPIQLCIGGSAACDDSTVDGQSVADGPEFATVNPAMQLRSTVAGTVL